MNYGTTQTVLYFGCWPGTGGGHYMWSPQGLHVNQYLGLPWGDKIDGVLQPGVIGVENRGLYSPHREEVQGHAALHQKDGWTAICFWDRSEDKRGGCNSNFFAHGVFTFDEMVQISKELFPTVWARFDFPVICVQDNGESVPEVMSMVEKAADYDRVVAELGIAHRMLASCQEEAKRLLNKLERLTEAKVSGDVLLGYMENMTPGQDASIRRLLEKDQAYGDELAPDEKESM